MNEADPRSGPGGDEAAGPPSSARDLAILCHLGGLAGYVVPFGGIVAPLVVWLLKRDEHPYIDEQGKEAVNFQITIAIYAIVATVLVLLLVGFVLLVAVAIFQIVMIIIAAVRASEGARFRYPATLRLLS